jgi:hypothetical protein
MLVIPAKAGTQHAAIPFLVRRSLAPPKTEHRKPKTPISPSQNLFREGSNERQQVRGRARFAFFNLQ